MEALHLLWLHLLWLYLLWQVLHWGLNLTEAFGVSQVRPLALTLTTLTALTLSLTTPPLPPSQVTEDELQTITQFDFPTREEVMAGK